LKCVHGKWTEWDREKEVLFTEISYLTDLGQTTVLKMVLLREPSTYGSYKDTHILNSGLSLSEIHKGQNGICSRQRTCCNQCSKEQSIGSRWRERERFHSI